MGNTSVIARRLPGNRVQNGSCGSSGHFKMVGSILLENYTTPELVEYLFGLGQLKMLWLPYSEYFGGWFMNMPADKPHYVDNSERSIFGHMAFPSHGYFYDLDHQWHYVEATPFRIKMPLALVGANVDQRDDESDFLEKVQHAVANHICDQWDRKRSSFRSELERKGYTEEKIKDMRKKLRAAESPLYDLYDEYRAVYDFFDDWVVVRPAEDGTSIGEIVMKPKGAEHIETIYW